MVETIRVGLTHDMVCVYFTIIWIRGIKDMNTLTTFPLRPYESPFATRAKPGTQNTTRKSLIADKNFSRSTEN